MGVHRGAYVKFSVKGGEAEYAICRLRMEGQFFERNFQQRNGSVYAFSERETGTKENFEISKGRREREKVGLFSYYHDRSCKSRI